VDKKNPVPALNLLQAAASPVEFGIIDFGNNISCLYPAYLRGEAHLAAGQSAAAAAEFQTFSTTAVWSGIAGREPWRIWEWRARMRLKRKRYGAPMQMLPASGRRPPTKISSPFGKTPTPTFPS
jgi:hypothetical protein